MMWRIHAVMAAAVLAVFAPNLPHWTTAAIGGVGTDSLKHIWSQWWVVSRLLQDGSIPLQTTLIHHPIGGAFFSLDTLNALIGLPLRAIAGPVATYNTVLVADLVLATWAGAALARALDIRPWPSALAGIGWALSAWVLAFPLASGVSETALFFPMPLVLLLVHRTLSRPGWTAPVLASLLLALQGLGCWSHGITTAVLVAIGTGWWLSAKPWRLQAGEPEALDLATAKRVLVSAGVLLAIVIPAYLMISGTVADTEAVKPREIGLLGASLLGPLDLPETNSMALIDAVLPWRWGLREGGPGAEQLYYSSYLGLGLLGLGLVGLRRGTRVDRALAWTTLAMVLLAAGPRIYLDHARTVLGLPNPLYLLLHAVFPLFNATLHSVDRLALGAQLPLALLAARGCQRLTDGRARPELLTLSAIGLVLAESLLISPAPWPLAMTQAIPHPAAVALAQMPGPGAVLDLPFVEHSTNGSRFAGDIFFQQTVHGRPIPFQLEGRKEGSLSPPVRANPFYRGMARVLFEGRSAPDGCEGARGLAQLGFRAVVWRPELSSQAQQAVLLPHLQRCLGTGQLIGGRHIFDLRDGLKL
jgi:hypothetical protein